MLVDGQTFKEGDWISLNGSTGAIYEGKIPTVEPELSTEFERVMEMSANYRDLKIRANADTPDSAQIARDFGATGIGLCRTEHMFFEGDRIIAMREMIMADDEAGRRKALDKLLPMQRSDFEGIFRAMDGFPVTIRLLDPPLHEFIPFDADEQKEMAKALGIEFEDVKTKAEQLKEINPMLGHRGCRLGNTYPEITTMQARAIIEAAANVQKEGIEVVPEIMIPLVGTDKELKMQKALILEEANKVLNENNEKVNFLLGTMIEVPRAALTADKIAKHADFFSFGTNDLTQMTYGFSRDDIGKFMPIYMEKGLLDTNPFDVIDRDGVGELMKTAVTLGKKVNPDIHLGLCGEHGADPDSVQFCHMIGLDYVSCSPFRVPIAILSAAQSAILYPRNEVVEA
jgi:pyruvate,orthophosphate dikinase